MQSLTHNIGIYSFPKSGTTWLTQIIGRCFNLDFPTGVHRYIPDMHQKEIMQHSLSGYGRHYFLYKSHKPHLVKMHRQKTINTHTALHIRRNPLDVFVSYLNYISDNVKGNATIKFQSVDAIKNSEIFDTYFKSFTLMGSIHNFIQTSGSYFDNNIYWFSKSNELNTLPKVYSIRYEDLFQGPDCLLPFTEEIGIPTSSLKQAYQYTRARQQDGKFYWKMKYDYYTEYLSKSQIQFFCSHWEKEIKLLGYEDIFNNS